MANKKIYKLKLDHTGYWISASAFFIIGMLSPPYPAAPMFIMATIMWVSSLFSKDTMIEISNDED